MKFFLQKSFSKVKSNKGQKTSFSIIKGNDTKINKIKGVSIDEDGLKYHIKYNSYIPNYDKKKIYHKEKRFSLNKSDVLELLSDSSIKKIKNKENEGNKTIEIKPKNKKSSNKLNISKIDNFKPVRLESRPIESRPIESKPIESRPVKSKSDESKKVKSKPDESKKVKSKLVKP